MEGFSIRQVEFELPQGINKRMFQSQLDWSSSIYNTICNISRVNPCTVTHKIMCLALPFNSQIVKILNSK